MKNKVYLDYNATSPIRPSVIEAVTTAMSVVGNPSSVHAAGRSAKATIEEARSKVAALVGSRPRDVMFCGGGTEANNTVINGAGASSLIVSGIEHDSVLAAAKVAGIPVYTVQTNVDGIVDLGQLEALLKEAPEPALVSVMMANNEMGVIQPVHKIRNLTKSYNARFHTDAIQAAGKINIDMPSLGADYLTLSSHKIGGPQGLGVVILAPTAPLKPLVVGGGQELGRRSGTENVAGIAGFGVAAYEALVGLAGAKAMSDMRDDLEQRIRAISNEAVIVGEGAKRLPNTSCIAMPGVKGETQVMHFDLAGICLSSGSACSSGKVKVSHVLSSMGYTDELAESSIRVSLGYDSKPSDVDAFVAAWKALYERVSKKA
ncbi:MAG: cysteine desulfurase family protein [Kordiimonas sp.]